MKSDVLITACGQASHGNDGSLVVVMWLVWETVDPGLFLRHCRCLEVCSSGLLEPKSPLMTHKVVEKPEPEPSTVYYTKEQVTET